MANDPILPLLEAALAPDALSWLVTERAALTSAGAERLGVLLPQLARRMGRDPLGGSRVEATDARVDLAAWRLCDGAGYALLEAAGATPDELVDLYLHGDMEERSIVLRSMAFLPLTNATLRLLGEVQRTNTGAHVEAGALDSNLATRALDAGLLPREDFHRLVLKLAFSDLPVWRLFGALDHADTELSGMLQDYATEREAAGRSVWLDTYRFIGRAPTDGSIARLIGGLEHGDDALRLAAAEGVLALGDAAVVPYAEARLPREARTEIRLVLERFCTEAAS